MLLTVLGSGAAKITENCGLSTALTEVKSPQPDTREADQCSRQGPEGKFVVEGLWAAQSFRCQWAQARWAKAQAGGEQGPGWAWHPGPRSKDNVPHCLGTRELKLDGVQWAEWKAPTYWWGTTWGVWLWTSSPSSPDLPYFSLRNPPVRGTTERIAKKCHLQ